MFRAGHSGDRLDVRMLRALRSAGRSATPALAHLVGLPDARVRTPPTGLSEPSDWIDMTWASAVHILESKQGSSDLDRTEPHGYVLAGPADPGPIRLDRRLLRAVDSARARRVRGPDRPEARGMDRHPPGLRHGRTLRQPEPKTSYMA